MRIWVPGKIPTGVTESGTGEEPPTPQGNWIRWEHAESKRTPETELKWRLPSATRISDILEQPAKARAPIEETEAGISTQVRELQY